MKKSTLIGEVITALTLVAVVVCNLGYSDEESASKFLSDNGYSDVVFKGSSYWGCGSSMEFYRTKFTATSPRGHKVSGVVCDGLLSEPIIRGG